MAWLGDSIFSLTGGWERIVAIWLAVVLDVVWRDPQNRCHPVAWMGWTLEKLTHAVESVNRPALLFGAGGLIVGGLGVGCVALGMALEGALSYGPFLVVVIGQAVVLKLMLSLNGLIKAAQSVATPLAEGDLTVARQRLAWHLVSRPTSELQERDVAGATLESSAENLNDSVMAPLVYYGAFGLAGALTYRLINTADAMLGYRDRKHQWLGKVPARLDDVVNWVPARLTAVCLVVGALIIRSTNSAMSAVRCWYRDRRQPASINGGQSMAPMAGALDIQLTKRGHYALNAEGRLPSHADIASGIRMTQAATALGLIVLTVLLGLVS